MRYLALLFSCILLCQSALANEKAKTIDHELESVKSAIEMQSKEVFKKTKIDDVRKTPIPGIYEVRVGKNLFYSNASGDYFFMQASLIDVTHKKNLTAIRKQELNHVEWSQLPLDKAVVSGDPNGILKLAIFTDPECPYCRQMEGELSKLKGVKIYNFLYPLPFHKNAKKWASAIWCAKDQHKMMVDIMLNKKDPDAGKCDAPIDEVIALGNKLGVNATPTLISGDGRMNSGGKETGALLKWLLDGVSAND